MNTAGRGEGQAVASSNQSHDILTLEKTPLRLGREKRGSRQKKGDSIYGKGRLSTKKRANELSICAEVVGMEVYFSSGGVLSPAGKVRGLRLVRKKGVNSSRRCGERKGGDNQSREIMGGVDGGRKRFALGA